MTNTIKNTKYTTCSTNKDSQCNLQSSTENMEGKHKTALKLIIFHSVLIVAKRILHHTSMIHLSNKCQKHQCCKSAITVSLLLTWLYGFLQTIEVRGVFWVAIKQLTIDWRSVILVSFQQQHCWMDIQKQWPNHQHVQSTLSSHQLPQQLHPPGNCHLAQHIFLRNFDVFLKSCNFCSGVQFSRNFGYFFQFWGGMDWTFNCCELWLLDTAVRYIWAI